MDILAAAAVHTHRADDGPPSPLSSLPSASAALSPPASLASTTTSCGPATSTSTSTGSGPVDARGPTSRPQPLEPKQTYSPMLSHPHSHSHSHSHPLPSLLYPSPALSGNSPFLAPLGSPHFNQQQHRLHFSPMSLPRSAQLPPFIPPLPSAHHSLQSMAHASISGGSAGPNRLPSLSLPACLPVSDVSPAAQPIPPQHQQQPMRPTQLFLDHHHHHQHKQQHHQHQHQHDQHPSHGTTIQQARTCSPTSVSMANLVADSSHESHVHHSLETQLTNASAVFSAAGAAPCLRRTLSQASCTSAVPASPGAGAASLLTTLATSQSAHSTSTMRTGRFTPTQPPNTPIGLAPSASALSSSGSVSPHSVSSPVSSTSASSYIPDTASSISSETSSIVRTRAPTTPASAATPVTVAAPAPSAGIRTEQTLVSRRPASTSASASRPAARPFSRSNSTSKNSLDDGDDDEIMGDVDITTGITKTTASGKRMFMCAFPGCTQGFTRRQNLRSHVTIHTNERPHPCMKCSATFRRRQELLRHERSVHAPPGVKNFQCSNCLRLFGRADALKRHTIANGGTPGEGGSAPWACTQPKSAIAARGSLPSAEDDQPDT